MARKSVAVQRHNVNDNNGTADSALRRQRVRKQNWGGGGSGRSLKLYTLRIATLLLFLLLE